MLEPIDSARDDAASSPPPARQGRSGSAKRAPLPGLPEQGENERPGAMGAGTFRLLSGGSFTAEQEEARAGIEPANSGFADRCLTTWLPRHEGQATNPPKAEQGSLSAGGRTTPPGTALASETAARHTTPPAARTAHAHDAAQLRGALDHVSDAIIATDASGRFLWGNAAARALLALPINQPLDDRTIDDALAAEAQPLYAHAREVALELGAWTGDLVLRRASGEDCAVVLTLLPQRASDGAVEGWAMVARELATPIRTRAADSQARRYEAMGRLSSGIAHDFQNLLASTLATSEHLLSRLSEGSAERADIEAIRTAAERSAGLVTQLLGYGRRAFEAPRASDLNAAVRHVEDLLPRLLAPAIALELDLAPSLPLVPMDRGPLEQALLTLAVVVRDALPSGGIMGIRTDEVVHAPAEATRSVAPPGRYVALTVSARRSGDGEHPTQRRRDDVGLALASITTLVVRAGGFVWAETVHARAAVYTIWIPRADDELPATLPG